MKIKERTIRELESLSPSELTAVYEMVVSLKNKVGVRKDKHRKGGYLRVRELLFHCKGALSEDIKLLRGDRV